LRNTIASYTGGLHHVEPVFELTRRGPGGTEQRSYEACSLIRGKPVAMLARDMLTSYENRGHYELFSVMLTPKERLQCYMFCLARVGQPFSMKALFNFVPCMACMCAKDPQDGVGWTCSSMIMAMLQEVREDLRTYNRARVHPQLLMDICRHHRNIFTPYVMVAGSLDGRLTLPPGSYTPGLL
jgi:hypothetical protein